MKISEGKYLCPWCNIIVEQRVNKTEKSGKKGGGSDMVRCPKCSSLISQKTDLEMRYKK